MTIRHLKIFIAVAETGSMSQAAKQLYLSQPTVSQSIRELEEHYGILLFERLSRRLYITEAGKRLLPMAHMISRQFDSMEESIHKETQRPALKVGSSITVGTNLMPSVVEQLQQRLPDIELYSMVGNTHEVELKILKSELDAGVVEGDIESPEIISIPVIEDQLVLACSDKHEFFQRKIIHPDDLSRQNFAIREQGSGTRKLFEQYLHTHNLTINVLWEANCPRSILNAVLRNKALAVMSYRTMMHEIAHGKIKIFKNTSGEWNRTFKLVYHKNKVITPEIELLEQILRQYQNTDIPKDAVALLAE